MTNFRDYIKLIRLPPRFLKTTAKYAAMVLILWYLVHCSFIQVNLLHSLLQNGVLLLFTGTLFIAMVLANAWRWRLLNAEQRIDMGFWRTSLATYLGTAFNSLLPGNVGGDVMRAYYLLGREPDKKSAVILSVLLDRVTGLLGIFMIVSLMGLIHGSVSLSAGTHFHVFFMSCYFICGLTVAFFILSLMLPERIGLREILHKRFSASRWVHPILSLLDAMHIYRHAKRTLVKCILISVLIQLFIVLAIVQIANMMHFPPVTLSSYAIAIAATQVANLIPITPGGIGIGEAAFVKVIMLLNPGISGPFATVFVAYRLIGMMVYLPGVVISFLRVPVRSFSREQI